MLLDKARVLASTKAQYNARQFLLSWRERDTLFYGRAAGSQAHQLVSFQKHDAIDADFYSAWNRCTSYKNVLEAVHIKYRWAEALLGRAYTNKIAQIEQNNPNPTKPNREARTEAIDTLFTLVQATSTRNAFKKRLQRATRWYEITKGLGWCIVALMAHESFPNVWVEQDLSTRGVAVWIKLVQKVRPDVYKATKELDDWLGLEGIAGGAIRGKTALYLESNIPPSSIVEVRDSDDESSDADIEPSQTQPSPATRGSLRQMTLGELFKPVA